MIICVVGSNGGWYNFSLAYFIRCTVTIAFVSWVSCTACLSPTYKLHITIEKKINNNKFPSHFAFLHNTAFVSLFPFSTIPRLCPLERMIVPQNGFVLFFS
uniref:Uncharacterized protein n=1 Tax=Anopheles funestus TaxID=62324 RepID=A0A182S3L4_ANOFN